jgi:hypothetical protein
MPYIEGAPPIASLDDLMTQAEVMEFFGVHKTTLTKWRLGYDNKPEMPYLRLNNIVYISRDQLVWWLNLLQHQVDPYHSAMRRRTNNKKGLKVGRPKKPRSV